ncbi:aspartate/glutamate racemase family protein [Psychrobacillus sp. NPDC093180]|uniref:aspartate/glutamate racemase family protein n=1 Tax=Psychrobacillus sp. NPDC093180 TaxID=3364489 RepID=UPI0038223248
MNLVYGGYVTFGQKLGILMLDTKFPRPVGDMGNAETWPFPVRYKVVKSASVHRVVKEGDKALIPLFIEAARELENEGVKALTTNCGFLSLFQREIQSEINIPFYSSNLMQIPLVYSIIGQKGKIGVLTASKATLTEEHFETIGVKGIPMVMEGMDDMEEFTKTIINGEEVMDLDKMREEVVNQAKLFVTNHEDVRAIVLECTNLTPYKDAIQKETGLPVFDIVSMLTHIHSCIV